MVDESVLLEIKRILREEAVPFFTDDEIYSCYERNSNDFSNTVYELLIVKAENCSISVGGFSSSDSSGYWLRLAAMYRKSASRIIPGG